MNRPDTPVQVAAAAGAGQGPGVVILGSGADPRLCADTLVEPADLAETLGEHDSVPARGPVQSA